MIMLRKAIKGLSKANRIIVMRP